MTSVTFVALGAATGGSRAAVGRWNAEFVGLGCKTAGVTKTPLCVVKSVATISFTCSFGLRVAQAASYVGRDGVGDVVKVATGCGTPVVVTTLVCWRARCTEFASKISRGSGYIPVVGRRELYVRSNSINCVTALRVTSSLSAESQVSQLVFVCPRICLRVNASVRVRTGGIRKESYL